MSYNIAVDGPAGAGKSTVAKEIAKRLGFIYVDTGAMYRAMALYMLRLRIANEEKEKMEAALDEADVTITYKNGEQQVLLNGENVSALLRTEEVGRMASAVALIKKARLKLVELQRKLAAKENVVMDGRDIGTYVLKDAQLKIYMTASVEKRAQRRFKELSERGETPDLKEIEADIKARDKQDMEREFAPLKQADDAVYLDTTKMSVQEAAAWVCELYEKKK